VKNWIVDFMARWRHCVMNLMNTELKDVFRTKQRWSVPSYILVHAFWRCGESHVMASFSGPPCINLCWMPRNWQQVGSFKVQSVEMITYYNKAWSEYKHVLANILRSRYVATATQPVPRLQIRPIVHN